MAPSKWTAAPTRREITLILFSLTTFIISFNFNSSLHIVGLQPTASLRKIGLGSDPGFDPDGRRPQAFRDDLENLIFGEWGWEEGQVAGTEFKKSKDKSEHGNGNPAPVHGEFLKWGNDRPATQLIAHTPGYSIIDSLVLSNGSFYIITDDPSHWPPLDTIRSPAAMGWQMISTEAAQRTMPAYAGSIHGVTWLSMDNSTHQDSHTIPTLWRTYSSLDTHITLAGATLLPPPSRIGFPYIRTFNDPKPTLSDSAISQSRSFTGFHQNFLKTAFPSMGVMYDEDWADLKDMNMPFLLERVVVADRGAAVGGTSREKQAKSASDWAGPFTILGSSQHWLEPIRKTLVGNLHVDDDSKELVVTYIARQNEQWGPRLRDEDHKTLVEELQRLSRDTRCTVNIVSRVTPWDDMMSAILKSTVVVGVYGEHLLDGIYMRPSSRSTLMEFWPAGTFVNDRELPAQSTGLNYMAWWTDKTFSGKLLPPASPPADARNFQQTVLIDPRAVVQAIRDLLQ